MTVSYHVSPSQLEKYLHCQRAWGARYIAALPEPPNKYALRGTAVHKVLEDWTLYAKAPDLSTVYGQIAYPALKFIPAPKTPGVMPERKVEWEIDGVVWHFIKDLELPGLNTHIWDYKTTSNLKYQKSVECLTDTDPAGILYSAHAFLEHKAHTVQLDWLYLTASPPHKCLPVIARPERKRCLDRFEWLQSTARVMLGHRERQTPWQELAPGPSYCNAFGGCPYKSMCQISTQDEFRSMLTMSDIATVKPTQSSGFLAAIAQFARPATQAQVPQQPAPITQTQLLAAADATYGEVHPPAPARETVVVDEPVKLLPWQKVVKTSPMVTQVVDVTPTIPDLVVPSAQPAPAKRKRRTKAEMAAARAAGEAPVEEEQPVDQEFTPPTVEVGACSEPVTHETVTYELTQEELDARKSRTMAETWEEPKSETLVADEQYKNYLLERVVLALCSNPGCAAMQSVDIVSKARAIVVALEVE